MNAFKDVYKKKSVNPEKCTVDMNRKTPGDKLRTVINFIDSVPQYESHYARNLSRIEKKIFGTGLKHENIVR